jgi:hypothetical protein
MTFIKKHAKTACLTDTSVENIFIKGLYGLGSGDYVRFIFLHLCTGS